MNKTDIAKLTAQTRTAAAAALEAQSRLAEAEAENYTKAQQARTKAAEEWRESYDAAADLETCRSAASNLMDAMRNSALGAALLEYARANTVAASRYRRALDHDSITGGPLRGSAPFKYQTVGGKPLNHDDFEVYLNGVLANVAHTLAANDAEEQEAEVEARLQAAYDSTAPSSPVAWRITDPEARTFSTTVGARVAQFVAGVAYTDETVARYYERKGFRVEPVWHVPEGWTDSASQVRGEVVTTTEKPQATSRPATAADAGLRREVRG